MTSTQNNTNAGCVRAPVFRFKMNEDVVSAITCFAKIHEHDGRHDYKDAWKVWCEENRELLDVEAKRLEMLGFTGDAYDKFFKSGRYYFRNKKSAKAQPVERKKYVGLSRDILRLMDDYITNNVFGNGTSPAEAFNQFCEAHKEQIMDEINVLLKEDMESNEISEKLKKTFKNRYFQKMKKIVS